ncbi:MAG: S8 family serine peptidase [Litorilituus sp.]|nr:S8 family serine peptidase [Litorilituus sp.]
MNNQKIKKVRPNKVLIAMCTALVVPSTLATSFSIDGNFNGNYLPSIGNTVTLPSPQGTDFSTWLAGEKVKEANSLPDRIIVKYKTSGIAQIAAAHSTMSNSSSDAFTPETLHSALAVNLSNKTGMRVSHLKQLNNNIHVFKVPSKTKSSMLKTLAVLQADNTVEYAEIDVKRHLMAQNQPWGLSNVQADQVSDNNASNMTVCIIDSGYEQANPDLNANNATGTNDSGTGNWYQNGGSHGTHVAGTIAGVNNNIGVKGILPNTNVNLHIVKVFNESGWGYSSDLVTAVNTCVNNGAKVVNMSLGGSSSSNTEKNGMQAAVDAGVLLIAASGNDGNATLSYPASYDSVMAVGAVDESGKHANFSQYTAQVEVAAPGEAILSTVAGDGRLGTITIGSSTYSNDRVVPQTHYIQSGSSYTVSNVNSSVTASLGSCSISGSSYNCSDVAGNICLAERNDNQQGSNYPEINPAKACMDAGAVGVIVYSNSSRPGLQNPFLVDATNAVDVPAVSVNRSLGQQLLSKLGQQTTLSTVGNQDYAYYNGTSMATPHVAGVAALAWSNNIDCTAEQVRTALKETAIDLESSGRDDKTGYGLVQTKAASDYLGNNCDGSTGGGGGPTPGEGELVNGQAQTSLAGAKDEELSFTMAVPAGATDLNFEISGGTGDADLYVKFGSAPTTSDYDCRPWKSGNAESCPISSIQEGTYYVKVIGYSAFTGVSLMGSYTESNSGGGAQGSTTETKNISASRRDWVYYTLEVPAGMATLDFNISGGSGDADLYIRKGSQPTTSKYDCRPYKNGNTETCNFTNPGADTWHIGIRAYQAFSGLTLTTSYQP